MRTLTDDFSAIATRLTELADAAATRTLTDAEHREVDELEDRRRSMEPKLVAKSANSAAAVLRDLGVSPTASGSQRATLGARIVAHPAFESMRAAGVESRPAFGFDLVLKDVSGVGACGPLLVPPAPPPLSPIPASALPTPLRVSDLLLNRPEDAPCSYFEFQPSTGSTAIVAAGAPKPDIGLVGAVKNALYLKIAGVCVLADELIEDTPEIQRLLDRELRNDLADSVDRAVLNNVGSATAWPGLIPASAGPDHATAVGESPAEALLRTVAGIHTASGQLANFCAVNLKTAIACASVTATDSGLYLAGTPFLSPTPAWAGGLVVCIAPANPDGSASIADGTALVGASSAASLVSKRGVRVDALSSGTLWTANLTQLRVEVRVALCTTRPHAFALCTGLPT